MVTKNVQNSRTQECNRSMSSGPGPPFLMDKKLILDFFTVEVVQLVGVGDVQIKQFLRSQLIMVE